MHPLKTALVAVNMVHCCVDFPLSVVENGWLSDRYRIGTDTGCIISNRIGYFVSGKTRYYVHHCRLGSW